MRLARAATEELGRSSKGKAVSLDTKADVTHTLTFPVAMYANWTVKRLKGKQLIRLQGSAGGELYSHPEPSERPTDGSSSTSSLKHRWRQKGQNRNCPTMGTSGEGSSKRGRRR